MAKTNELVALETAKAKNHKLANTLPDIYLMIKDLLVYPEQKERFIDFAIDILAIADAENSFRENTQMKFEELYSD